MCMCAHVCGGCVHACVCVYVCCVCTCVYVCVCGVCACVCACVATVTIPAVPKSKKAASASGGEEAVAEFVPEGDGVQTFLGEEERRDEDKQARLVNREGG